MYFGIGNDATLLGRKPEKPARARADR